MALQWHFYFRSTNASYSRTNIAYTDAGSYSVVVTNVAGTITSSNSMLVVRLPQPAQFGGVTLSSN